MNFELIKIDTAEIEMGNVPVNWGPTEWTYGKDLQAEREAKEANQYSTKSIFGELIKNDKFIEPWTRFSIGSLVIGTRTSERSIVRGDFWISTEPFVYVETSNYKCPSCHNIVLYSASPGWICSACKKEYGRSIVPDFMLPKKLEQVL